MSESAKLVHHSVEQRFNDDLLIDADSRRRAHRLFSREVFQVLDFPELTEIFQRYEEPAKRAKTLGRRAGAVAVVLATTALLGASAALLYKKALSHGVVEWISGASALLGICSIVILYLFGLHSRPKRRWLLNRLMAERLRQLHFQIILTSLRQIQDGLRKGSLDDYFALRRQRLDEFLTVYAHHPSGMLEAVLRDENDRETYLVKDSDTRPINVAPELNELFAALRLLRLRHQRSFADHKLAPDTRVIPASPERQEALLRTVSLLAILVVFFLHLVTLGQFALPHAPTEEGKAEVGWSELLHAAAIWLALIALAARVFEEGLHPSREVERYEHYRWTIDRLLERFESASGAAEQLKILNEAERAAYQEMRSFLRIQNGARFAL